MSGNGNGAWWRKKDAVLELLAFLAISAAVGLSLWRNKLEPEQAILMLVGGIATVNSAIRRLATEAPRQEKQSNETDNGQTGSK